VNPNGKLDRIIRIIIGLFIIVFSVLSQRWWLSLCGVVIFFNVFRYCRHALCSILQLSPKYSDEEKYIDAGYWYFLVGVIALILSKGLHITYWFAHLLKNQSVLWCIAWSGIGIGAGLINIRDHEIPSSMRLHFIGYYGFVLLVVSLFSFTVVELRSESWFEVGVKFKALAALIGLIGGFLGNVYNLSKKWLDK